MSDNRKYYYLKLKENYFDEDAIVLLESMQDGILYSNILLKLYLKSLKNGGKLQLDENIPYTAQMIATITRQQVGTVERALQIFMKLGLVEPLQNGALYMSNIELLIGQSSTEGERKRRARLALQEQKALPKAGADICPPYQADICPPEIEIEKEIEINPGMGGVLRVPQVVVGRDDQRLAAAVTAVNYIENLFQPRGTEYDRLLSMCVPVRFTGDNFRQETAQRKMESMKKLITD